MDEKDWAECQILELEDEVFTVQEINDRLQTKYVELRREHMALENKYKDTQQTFEIRCQEYTKPLFDKASAMTDLILAMVDVMYESQLTPEIQTLRKQGGFI